MKNILIIRSANFSVIDILIDYINEKNDENINIYFLTQESTVDIVKEKVEEAKIFVLPKGNFNYKIFKDQKELINGISRIEFEEVYIPSSYEYFEAFEEVQLIASSIKSKRIISFNCYGKVSELSLNFCKLYFAYKITFPFKFIFAFLVTIIVYFTAFIYHIVKYHILKKEV